MFAGSDAHQIEDVGRAGIKVPRYIDSVENFIQWYDNNAKAEEHIYIN